MTTVLESLNSGLHAAMADERVYLIGEDLLDPYGGAFKVAMGLSTQYPSRVLTSPISEAGIVGLAGGMALRGLRPVVEIMFGDFITLAADQLINSLSKFRWMYNETVEVPVVVRAPMGGRRGYGPTHSQTLEKIYLGVPGLRVIAPTSIGDPGELLKQAILADNSPTLFIENKLQYLQILDPDDLQEFDISVQESENSYTPGYLMSLQDAPPPILTIVTYGYMTNMVIESAKRLAYENEIFTEIVILTQLSPFELFPVTKSVLQTQNLLVVEEGTLTHGWGAEVIARIQEDLGVGLKNVRRVAAKDLPIPASIPLENEVLPNIQEIMQKAQKMV
ncbi:MAG: alpha-ketoacid dehydrogenase subunit beta [Chloroflexota bacterium]